VGGGEALIMAASTKRPNQPFVSLDEESLIARLALLCEQNGPVTTDAGWSTAIDALSDAQFLLLQRAIVKKWIKVG
jgi:hypothetical protein